LPEFSARVDTLLTKHVQAAFVTDAHLTGFVHALDNVCPHRGAPLGQGWVRDVTTADGSAHTCLVCPYHGWAFDTEGATFHGFVWCARITALFGVPASQLCLVCPHHSFVWWARITAGPLTLKVQATFHSFHAV